MSTTANDLLLEAVRLTSQIWDIGPALSETSDVEVDAYDLTASLDSLNRNPPDIELALEHAELAAPVHPSFQQFLDHVRELHAFVNKPSSKPVFTEKEGHHPDNKLG